MFVATAASTLERVTSSALPLDEYWMSRTGRQKRVCPRIWETPGEAVPFKTFPVLGSRSGGGSPGFGAIATATTAGFKRAHANKTELAPLRNAAAAAGHVTVGSEQALRSLG